MQRKKDPFDFDDIYRQAGVEDLFVKKTMMETKKVPTQTPSGQPQQPSASSSQASRGELVHHPGTPVCPIPRAISPLESSLHPFR